ncbi:MAG: GNAT family N-acetyltransferase [Clostridia bacterium]
MENWRLELISKQNRKVIENLFELYQYELSDYFMEDVKENGKYEPYEYLDTYFTNATRNAYFVKVNNQYAGFILINEYTMLPRKEKTKSIAEFFILKRYRKQHLGRKVIAKILEKAENWEVKVLDKNKEASDFWKGIIREKYEKVEINNREDKQEKWTIYYFSNQNRIEGKLNSRYYIGKTVNVVIDRPLGSSHPKYPKQIYSVNYGYIPNTISGDKEELDAYVLGEYNPLSIYTGECIAVIHRLQENDDKLIIVSKGKNFTNEQIRTLTDFQERYYESILLR